MYYGNKNKYHKTITHTSLTKLNHCMKKMDINAQLVGTTSKNGYVVKQYSITETGKQKAVPIHVVYIASRGWIGVFLHREKMKCLDFVNGSLDTLGFITGLPMLETDLSFGTERACSILALRAYNLYKKEVPIERPEFPTTAQLEEMKKTIETV